MARGAPDYSNVRVDKLIHRVDDMAELAARLGSPNTHERCGNVVFMETFEHGMSSWTQEIFGVGGEIEVSAEQFRTGGYSCKLKTRNVASSECRIYRFFPYPEIDKYGLEWSMEVDDYLGRVIVRMNLSTGIYNYRHGIKYDQDARTLSVEGVDGNFHVFASGLDLHPGSGLFHTIKFVVDFTEHKYVRAIVNETTYDLSLYEPYRDGSIDTPHIAVYISAIANGNVSPSVYIDDVILTRNEP